MNRHSIAAAALLLLGKCPPCGAQDPVSLDPILITASRVAQTTDETLASVSVIERGEMEKQQAKSVPELLGGLPGITASSPGGPGNPTSLFLRGTNSDHVLILIDGVKVGSPTLGTTPLEHIPVEQIERIEVVRGPRASLYGSEAIGGVIQIFTRKGGGRLAPSFSLGAGSHDTYDGSASLSGGGERAWFNASVSGVDTRGFNACNGEPDVAGCFTVEPDRDGYRNLSGSLRAGYRFPNGAEVDAHWLRVTGDTEFDGDFQNESNTVQEVLGASVHLTPHDRWDLSFNAGRSRDDSDNFKSGVFSTRFETERDTASLQSDVRGAKGCVLTVGLDYQDDRVGGTTAYPIRSRDNTGWFGQYLGHLGPVQVQASVRRDENEQFGNHSTGGFALGYSFGNGPQLTVSYGSAFKAPTFNELYFPEFGNPDLRPEESESFEFRLNSEAGWIGWSLSAYQTDLDDLIAFDANTYAPANIDGARIRGLEAAADASPLNWDVRVSLTLLDPVNRGPGADRNNLLPRRPQQSLRLDLDRSLGRWGMGATLIAEGERYDDIARELDAYATLALRGEYRFAAAWRVQTRIDNLFDRDYETASFYNQPGRSFFLTLRYQP